MECVDGKVSKLSYDSMGFLNGFVLGRGQQVRFWVTPANVSAITKIVMIGSRVGVQGDFRSDSGGEEYFRATLITNLDSKRTASLSAVGWRPDTVASRAHVRIVDAEPRSGENSHPEGDTEVIDLYLRQIASQSEPSACSSDENPWRHNVALPRAASDDAAAGIERAYDGLHRIQAILAYLNIVKQRVPGISQFLDEAKHTYEQALSRHKAHDFEGAREFAAACRCLSRLVEVVISRTLRSDTSYPSLVSPPPDHSNTFGESSRMREDLTEVQSILSRIHWLVERGTLPLENRTQVRRIASWGDAFYQQTRRMYRSGSIEDASELVEAANSAAHSAEHICRNWYVAHTRNRRIAAPEQSPQP
jgi:hypothetical protein